MGTQTFLQPNPTLALVAGPLVIRLRAGAGTCSDTTSRSLVVTPPPARVAFNPDPRVGCSPLLVNLNVAGTPQPGVTYAWSFGDGQTSTDFRPAARAFTNVGTTERKFKISVVARNGCGNLPSDEVEITVRPQARAEIGIDSTDFRCTPARIRFSNRSQGHDPATARWIWGDGTSQTTPADTVSHVFSARDSSRTYQIRLVVANACKVDTATTRVRVFPSTMRAQFQLSKTQLCPGEPVQFRDASTPVPTQWLWTFGDGNGSAQANPQHSYTQPNRTYRVVLRASNGCVADSIVHTVQTTARPVAGLQVPADIVCQGQPVRLTPTPIPANGFSWSFGDGLPADSVTFSPSPVYPTAGTKTVTLTVYGTSRACKNSVQQTLTVRNRPKAGFRIEGDSVRCVRDAVQLVSTSTDANRYLWRFSDGKILEGDAVARQFPRGPVGITLVASYDGVCVDSVSRVDVVNVLDCTLLEPDAFSPNGDGTGDRYTLFGEGIRKITRLRIRNRWDEILFEGTDLDSNRPEQGWNGDFNGRPAPVGQYVYEAEVEYVGQRKEQKRGTFYLVR